MKIAIVVYSQTGNTRKFAEIIEKKLKSKKHATDLFDLKVTGDVHPGAKNFKISNSPDISSYDTVLIGTPVWAFSSAPVIPAFLKNTDLKGKKVLPFVTMGFPFKVLGGTRAISVLSKAAANNGAEVLPGSIVTKLFHNYMAMMLSEGEKICDRLK